jgi:hypothetical protein
MADAPTATRAGVDHDVGAHHPVGRPLVVVEPAGDCPGRKPPFLAVKHPARPYKSTIENQST